MTPKLRPAAEISRFPAFAKSASAGEGRSDRITLDLY
jgi:hypothetical protein